MKRRRFLQLAGAVSLTVANRFTFASALTESDVFKTLVRQNDDLVKKLLQDQETDASHQWYGAIRNDNGIHYPILTANYICYLVSAFVTLESKYYKSNELVRSLELAVNYMNNVQHKDGTIDLLSTNFHSTPDTAFAVEWIAVAYTILDQSSFAEMNSSKDALGRFLKSAGNALTVGGIHTPNHRWVVSMGLARIHHLFPDEKYVKRINQWLNEKIDIDVDGQFNEKSTAIYSPTVDRCLLTIARLLDKTELFEPVRRNLDMTKYYVHPNGDVDTTASRRQDHGRRMSMAPYYYSYRYMALKDKNGQYASMCKLIENTAIDELKMDLPLLIEDKSLTQSLTHVRPLPTHYAKHFSGSELVRIRRGDKSATIAVNNSTFFSFYKGNAALTGLRFASSFFGRKGQFSANNLQIEGNRYILTKKVTGPYYQPYPVEELPNDGDWEKMPRANRPLSEIQTLISEIEIVENDGEFTVNFHIHGTDRIPFAIELGFRDNGTLQGVVPVPGIENAFLLESGMGSFSIGDDLIQFGPGQAKHTWTQLRGAEPKLEGKSVYITGYTPLQYTLKIS